MALDSSLGRWFRASGNYYCKGDSDPNQLTPMESRICTALPRDCEGQIVRFTKESHESAWSFEVIDGPDLPQELVHHGTSDETAAGQEPRSELR